MNADGTSLVYSTFLGGGGDDQARGIALDSSGNAYVAGYTDSTAFPTTTGAFDTTYNGGVDAFVTKLSADGASLTYSTFLGGTEYDYSNGIALDSSGNAYVMGNAQSTDFPTTTGAFDTSYNGGTHDVFVLKLSADGASLTYSTYLGGSGADNGNGIAVDGSGNAYVTGQTGSNTDFPTTTGAYDTSYNGGVSDVFVTQLHAKGGVLLYSTYLGGSITDSGRSIALDSSGNAYVTGVANPPFPTTAGAYDESHNGSSDAFVTKLSLWKSPYLFVGNFNAQYGDTSVTLKAKMTHPYNGSGLSGKTVSVTVDGGASANYTTDTNGEVSFTYNPSAKNVGDVVPISATFAGDSTYDAKTATGNVIIKKASVNIVVASAVLRANYRLGQAMSPQILVTLTTAAGIPISGATLDFTLDGTSIGSASTMSGVPGEATLAYTPPTTLGTGAKALVITFAATTNYFARTRTVNLTFSKTPTVIVLPAVSGNRNTSVNLVATLTNKDISAALSGKTVKFFVGGSLVGQATTNASGVATLSYLLGGTAQKQSLSATYDGDATFAATSKPNFITTK